MKKRFLTVSLVCLLLAGSTSSCIGSFSLFNKLLSWNQGVGSKFVNELVFFAFLIVPVYEVATLADMLVLNTIEFWSGSNPVAQGKTVIDGKDGKYLVECDGKGYTITSMNDGTQTRLNFNVDNQTWSLVGLSGTEYPLVQFIDDNRVLTPGIDGQMHEVELTQDAVWAYLGK